jgi:hypothetical protein
MSTLRGALAVAAAAFLLQAPCVAQAMSPPLPAIQPHSTP